VHANAARPSLRLGRHASRFVLEELLGTGGNGSVHRAYDRKLGLEVALKIPHRGGAETLLALKREFRILAGLAHPNLLALHELFVADASWFFTMDLVDGTDLLRFLDGRGLGHADDRQALVGVVDGLAALHEAGVVHRDLKPSNTWIDRGGQAVLLDFGLASLASDAANAADGTALYLAPELLEGGRPSAESDAYALGVMLFEALTGARPFDGSAAAIRERKLREDAAPIAGRSRDAPRELVEVVDALLRRDPAQRPRLVDVRRALRGAEHARSLVTPAPETPLFVGRDALLASLDRALDDAREEVRVVRLAGPPGIGKSALLAQLRARIEPRALVIAGRCSEHETVPFAVLDDAMDALSKILRSETEEALVRGSLMEIAAVAEAFPALELAIPNETTLPPPVRVAEPRERRRRVAAGIRTLLDGLAARRPVALLLDDVQWADEDGASLLAEILACESAHGLFVVLAQRDGEGIGRTAALDAIPDVVELSVPPLAFEDARILAAHFGGSAAAERVASAAGGSPFLLEALARVDTTLETSGADGPEGDLATRAIASRVSSLSEPARALLETSVIAGHPLSLETARAALADGVRLTGAVDIGAVRRLEALRLLRIRSPRRGAIELVPYHDRVREIVVAAVPLASRRRTHASLARALEARGETDVLRLCMHHREANDLVRAAALAELGAAEAEAHLAFARAVELYQFALAQRPRDERARELRVSLGEALVNAGRSAEAAAAFLHALEDTVEPDARLDLRRRASEQLLRVGHFQRGVALLDEVLLEAGVPIRRSPALALFSLVRRRAGLVRRAMEEAPERSPSELDRAELRRIDACVSGAMGLSVVDSLRSADLMSEALSRALDHGDGRRLAVCTLWQAAFAANEAGPGEARTRALLARGTELAARHGGAYERGCVCAASALTEFHLGHFRKALAHTLVGERVFLEETRGTRKESATMQIFSLAAQAMLGEIGALSRRVEALERDATGRGDRYAATNVQQGLPTLRWLALDDPRAAHEDLDRAMRGFDASGFTVQHFFDLFGRIFVLLYEGRVDEARRRYEADRGRLARSLLSRTQWTRVHTGLLDVWTALALAREQRGLAREASLLAARVRLARLGREDRPWVHAITSAMRGELARASGRADVVDASTVTALASSELGLYAALGEIARGTEAGAAWSTANAIREPRRLARIVFPGTAISRSS
jgi:tetratricopeptide (TPR) repeat protein